jgi:hypothetical protein
MDPLLLHVRNAEAHVLLLDASGKKVVDLLIPKVSSTKVTCHGYHIQMMCAEHTLIKASMHSNTATSNAQILCASLQHTFSLWWPAKLYERTSGTKAAISNSAWGHLCDSSVTAADSLA